MAYAQMLTAVKPNSDLIIDGLLPMDDIVDRILEDIEGKFKVRVMNDEERSSR
ncbi:hypothetical protein ABEX25_19445 [Paenibacillus thiaminolyticus]|uniref:hypothetical protein n=1 Tax=Paenibacillus thiaminolyticus TaxID=49283 RepID=UPI003D27CB99